jgi:hypothetical protein
LEKNLSNRLSGKKNRIFDDGVLAIEHLKIEAGEKREDNIGPA